jgi:hypothetical protein
MKPETKEQQLHSLQAQELFLRAQLIDICLTYGNPNTNKLFNIEKRMSMKELFDLHYKQMPAALLPAYKKLCQMRAVLKSHGVDVGTI